MRRSVGIAHLSDTHVPAATSDEHVSALGRLDAVLESLAGVEGLDVLIVSGDISDDGSRAGAEAVRDRIESVAIARGLGQVFAIGNTDSREAFRAVFASGHRDARGADAATAQLDADKGGAVSEHDGLRVITLDSTVAGELHGELSDDQLSWLSNVLASSSPRGTVLVMHHPPTTVEVTPWLSSVALRSSDALADVIESSDVRAVLTGHFHAPALGFLGRTPVWVSPAVESRLDVAAPSGILRFFDDAAASVIRLPHDGPPSFVTVQVGDAGRVVRDVALPTA